jgi:hypothetical protein
MNYVRQHFSKPKLVLLSVVCLAVIFSAVKHSTASIGTITKADLSGNWQTTLLGNTGCGLTAMLVTFTLNGSGGATNATITSHVINPTATCPDGAVSTGNNFAIMTLASNGSGTAGLTCGASCGWTFRIQVSPDRSIFNLVDVATFNPNNLLQGTAIHQ